MADLHGRPQTGDLLTRWKRASLATWDERWRGLSIRARRLFADFIKVSPTGKTAMTPASRLSEALLEELRRDGLIVLTQEKGKPQASVPEDARDFALRIKACRAYRILEGTYPTDLRRLVDHVYRPSDFSLLVSRVLASATGDSDYWPDGDLV